MVLCIQWRGVTKVFHSFNSLLGSMDWAFVHKTWDKWASTSIGSSGEQALAGQDVHNCYS